MITEVKDPASKPRSLEGGKSSAEKARRDIILGSSVRPPARPKPPHLPPIPPAKRSVVNTESYARSNHGRSDIRQHFPWLESGQTSHLLTFSSFAGTRSDPSFISRSPGDPLKKEKKKKVKSPTGKKKGD